MLDYKKMWEDLRIVIGVLTKINKDVGESVTKLMDKIEQENTKKGE